MMMAAAQIQTPRPRFISVGATRRAQQARRPFLAVRAVETATESTTTQAAEPSTSATYFFRGKAYNQAEWDAANASGAVNVVEPSTGEFGYTSSNPDTVDLGELMGFSGRVPEIANGRLAMLAFVAALGAELSTGESVLGQLKDEPTGIMLTVLTFAVATIIPFLDSEERKAFGPFTPSAEMLNGRAAMLGFAALLVAEAARGGAALFG